MLVISSISSLLNHMTCQLPRLCRRSHDLQNSPSLDVNSSWSLSTSKSDCCLVQKQIMVRTTVGNRHSSQCFHDPIPSLRNLRTPERNSYILCTLYSVRSTLYCSMDLINDHATEYILHTPFEHYQRLYLCRLALPVSCNVVTGKLYYCPGLFFGGPLGRDLY